MTATTPVRTGGPRHRDVHADLTARHRAPDIAALGAVAGLGALLPLPAVLRAVFLAVFVAVGPGSAVLTWVRIPARARLSTVPVLGMSIVTLIAIIAMWSNFWSPGTILWIQVVAVAASSLWWYRRHGGPALPTLRRPSIRLSPRAIRTHPALLLSGVALLIWLCALPGLPGIDASYYGLLFSGTGPLLALALVLCTVSLVVAVRARQVRSAIVALGSAIAIARLTTTLTTEVPLYDWTYKHLGVVDYIMTHGQIQPDGTDLYAQWSAFFVTFAWFSDVTGIEPIIIAHVFAPIIHVLIALTVFTAARVIGYNMRTAVTAAYIVEVVNWVGQEYFSPQAWTLVLAFGLIALLLASPGCPAAGVLGIVVFAATVPTHQLTPFWALGTACLLCVSRRARPWWIAIVMVAIAGGYLLLHLEAVLPYGLLSGGSPVSNATSNIVTSGMAAKTFASMTCRILSAAVILSAAACAVWAWRRHRPVLAVGVVAFSSFGLLMGQNYGGEAIFRVYLYALLGCGLLIAPAVVSVLDGTLARERNLVSTVAVTVGLCAATVAGLHAYVALWPFVYQTREQVQVMQALTMSTDVSTRFAMLHPGGMPTRSTGDYAEMTLRNPYFDEAVSYDVWSYGTPDMDRLRAEFPTATDIDALNYAAHQHTNVTYVMFSEQANKAARYYGEYRPEATAEFQTALENSPLWTLVYKHGETVIYRFVKNRVPWSGTPPPAPVVR